MPGLHSLTDTTALHILSYSTLLGTSLFNTFLTGPLSFTILPRPSFSQLQQRLFPYYFSLQTLLPLTCALTFPSLGGGGGGASTLSQHPTFLWPLTAMFGLGAINMVIFGPWTTRVMRARKHQETRDGKRYYDSGPQSADMQTLNTKFNILHGVSSLANLADILVMVWYGFALAERITLS